MKSKWKIEYETKLNQVCLHIYTQEKYEEDYQIPMLRRNQITGMLSVDRYEVEGAGRYTYDISGAVSMKSMYEKNPIKKQDMQELVQGLLETAEELQRHLLNPDCLLLEPEYIFRREGKWYFCYLPEKKEPLHVSFHGLSEYFVKMLDYEDMEGIYLAYELHKATLQEHCDLGTIMKEYEARESERNREMEGYRAAQAPYGNIFSLAEEEAYDAGGKQESESERKYEAEEEEKPFWRSFRKRMFRLLPGKSWGQWEDLILETDGQEEDSAL